MLDRLRSAQTAIAAALFVFAVAFALRFTHLWQLRSSFADSGLFSIPIVDAAHHWKEALAILDGNPPLREGVPWKGPGYSYFLAALAALFGRSIGAVRWPLAVLGSLNCVLLLFLARRYLDLRWSVVAALLAAVNGLLIVYDTEPYQPTLLIALNLGALLLLSAERPRSLALAGAGLLLGLACLVHPAYLLPSALLAVWAFRRCAWKSAALVGALALTIAPVTLNNAIAHGESTLISWNGGVNVYAANHPTFDQRAGNGTQAWGRLLRAPVDAGIDSVSDRDRLYYRLAAERALRYPLATLGVLARKCVVFFSPVEYSSNFPIYDLRERSAVVAALLWQRGALAFPFGLWAPAALIGLAVALRRAARSHSLPALWAFGVLLTNVLVFNTARYRAPVVLLGGIWVAVALAASCDLWKTRRIRRLGAGVGLYLLLALLLAFNAVPQRDLPPPHEWYQAQAIQPGGSFDKAAEWAERAVARDPRSAKLLVFVSEFYGRWGERERQRAYLRRALELPDLEPDTLDRAHELLAASYFVERRFEESRAELLEALAVAVDDAQWRGYPHYPLGIGPIRSCILRLRLADVEIHRGDFDGARGVLESVGHDCPPSESIAGELESLRRKLAASTLR